MGQVRLAINFVGTVDAFKREASTRLVGAAEEWGRQQGATVSICDAFVHSPLSIVFWEQGMVANAVP